MLKMDIPEKILSQAHGKVRTVADFLYENGKETPYILFITKSINAISVLL